MEIKRVVKRMFAVGAGAAMLGATAMGALAADLKDYPHMFVSEGSFNGYFVIGENSKPIDNIAMTDIATSMKYLKAESASGAATVEGDAWEVGTSAKIYEMGNNNASESTIAGETINGINTFIGDDELDALADGEWSTNEEEYEYQQFLFWDSTDTTSTIVKYSESDDDVTADHFFVKNDNPFARYKIEFSSTAQSDVTDSSGSSSTTGTYLDDFENTQLSIMGKEFTVVQARRPNSPAENSVKLVLMAGAATDTLLEGESKTYDAAGKKYDIVLSYVDAADAKFTVNGEATNKLSVGDTFILSDGSEIGVSELLYQDYAGGIHSATFYVGAQKWELRDNDVETAGSGSQAVKIGSEDIEGTKVKITGTDNNATFAISTIEINMTAEDDYFVPAGKKLSDIIVSTGDEKEILLGGLFDAEYKGLTTEETHDVRIKTSSARRYKLHLFDGDDKAVDLPLAYAEAQFNLSIGEDGVSGARSNQKRLALAESELIEKDDYFIVTAGTPSSGSAKSYLMQYKSSDASTDSNPKIKFKNLGSGETLEYSVSSTNATATIKLGGYSFEVYGSGITADDFPVKVALNGDNDITDAALVNFIDSFGSQWAFTVYPANLTNSSLNAWDRLALNSTEQNFITVTMSTPNTDDYDNTAPTNLVLNVTSGSGPELDFSLSGYTLISPDGETEVSYGYTSMGAFLTHENPSSDPSELTLVYPKAQRVPQVFVTTGATTTGSRKTGDWERVSVVDAVRFDSAISDAKAQNLIVVGGPCVNSVAAELLGNPDNCADGFTAGKARVKLFEHANGNVAMLVAGYSGEDTQLAGRVIAQQPEKLTGMELEIEGTSLRDVQVGAPSPAAPAAEPAAEPAAPAAEQ